MGEHRSREYATRDEFDKLTNEFREFRAVTNTRLDHLDKLETDIKRMQDLLSRIDERQLQMQTQLALQLKQTNDTMNKQFQQVAGAIDRIIDHLLEEKKPES